jgi:hypothetical protein
MKTLDSFERAENPLSNGGKWTVINGFAGTGACKGSPEFIGKAWLGAAAGEHGAFWNPKEFTEPAVSVKPIIFENVGEAIYLYACLSTPTTTEKSGYRVKVVVTKRNPPLSIPENTFTVERMVKGAFTVLATGTYVGFMSGDTVGLQVAGGRVIAWHKVGGEAWVERASASDSTFTSGFVGFGAKTETEGPALNEFAQGLEAIHPLTASLTPAGKVTELKTFLKALSASLTPAASLHKVLAIVKGLTPASLAPNATLRKSFALVRSFLATLEPGGTMLPRKLLHNRTPPTIVGPAVQGIAELEEPGAWEHGPILSTTYQWLREGTPIEGATDREYVPTPADIGHTLTVVETVTDETTTASAESLPTAAITAGVPTNEAPPIITGPAREGEVEFESHGVWDVPVESYEYEWFRCDPSGGSPVPIEGAHRKTYVPVPADVGHTLRVSEAVTNAAGTSLPAVSAQTPVIEATAATSTGLLPSQPDVPEPVLKWPFRMAADESHIPFIEQDTAEEYEQCVALVLTTRPGEFPDEPDFGFEDPTFSEGGVQEADLSAAVRRWEPRAHVYFTLDELIDFAQEVGIKVEA